MNNEKLKTHARAIDRRAFLRQFAFLGGGFAAMGFAAPIPSFAQQRRASGPPSMSRQFARWVAGLRYEDLPPAVLDRAKGLTLHGLASALQGYPLPGGQEAIKLVSEEGGG